MKKPRYSSLFVRLVAVYVTSLLISNILAVKQFAILGYSLPAAVVIFPVVYILSDVFSECYGYAASRNTRYLAFACNLLMSLMFVVGIALPAAESFTGQDAMALILGNTPRMLIASFAGFLLGDFANDRIFKVMKAKHPDSTKGFKLRAILSSLVGEACDSLLFYPIAFAGVLPIGVMVQMGILQVVVKVAYETIISPVTKVIADKINEYENNNATKA